MAGFRAAASARYPPTLVSGLLPHHWPATRVISSLHLPLAGYLCFTRPCIVRRRGSGPASSPRVPPLRTPAEESLGYFNDSRRTRRRRHASPPATVAVACALGTACLLHVAVFVAPMSLSRLARRRSITQAAASGDGGGNSNPDQSEDPTKDSAKDGTQVSNEGPALTPIMLEKILLRKPTDSAKIHLVRHVFTAALAPDKQLELLERVYQLAFPERNCKTEVFSKDLLGGDQEKLDAGLAMAQIYMEMNKYKDAEQVLERLSERIIPSKNDKRLDLLKAANNVMLAVDLLRSKGDTLMLAVDLLRSKGDTLTIELVDELIELIAKFKTCLDEYQKGPASTPPNVNKD